MKCEVTRPMLDMKTSHIDKLSYNLFHNNSNASFTQASYVASFPNYCSEKLQGYSVARYKTIRQGKYMQYTI